MYQGIPICIYLFIQYSIFTGFYQIFWINISIQLLPGHVGLSFQIVPVLLYMGWGTTGPTPCPHLLVLPLPSHRYGRGPRPWPSHPTWIGSRILICEKYNFKLKCNFKTSDLAQWLVITICNSCRMLTIPIKSHKVMFTGRHNWVHQK